MHRCALVTKAKESGTHVVGECYMYNEKRDVLDEMRNIRQKNVIRRKLVKQDNSERAIAAYEIDGGHKRRNRNRMMRQSIFNVTRLLW